MYFIDAIKYPFNSQGVWGKIGTAFILMLPIINFFGMFVIAGYGIKIIGSVMHGDENLPEFDLGGDFMRGLLIVLVGIVYQIPSWILTAIMMSMINSNNGLLAVTGILMVIVSIMTSVLLMVAVIRYATTEDTNVFMAVGDNLGYLSRNPGAVLLLIVNIFLYGIAISIILAIGFALLILPGIILSVAMIFSSFYLYARFGMELGIGGKAKHYA